MASGDTVPSAAALRLQADPGIRFLFAGGGHLYTHLQDTAAAQGRANTGFQPYQDADKLPES